MTDNPTETPLVTDGGTDEPPTVKQTTVTAKGVTTAEIDGEEREVLRVPISSTRSDREGDRFTKDALDDMAEQIRSEQPHVFDNHGLAGSWMDAIPYDSRETIGTQHDAEVETFDDGEAELFALVNPDGTHPEGERMLKQVRDEKQAIKFSVGFGIKDEEPIEDEAGNEIGREFQRADLMETSRVGIPANPDASVATASAKGGAPVAPGYAMHPLFRAMLDPEATGAAAVKSAGTPTDEGGDEDLRAAVAELRAEVEALREEDDAKGSCEVDDDCPDGEVCVDGECVPEDEVDDDDEEESASADPDDDKLAELRDELDELRESIKEQGRSKTADPSTEPEDPDLTNSGEPDAGKDAPEDDPDAADHETII